MDDRPGPVEWIVHVGAPRTGTSYLRKYVFPSLGGIQFLNKQSPSPDSRQTVKYFADLAHSADGDWLKGLEIAELGPPEGHSNRVLVSEEHFLWSPYHMFGDTVGRAALLKRAVPDARIIISIRHQPEHLISLYKYLSSLPKWHLHRQLDLIENMVDLEDRLSEIALQKFAGIPVGLGISKGFRQKEAGEHYFSRENRHFLSATISWTKVIDIYAELFGAKNVLVLPQEMTADDVDGSAERLSKFLGAPLTLPPAARQKRVNAAPNVGSPFKSAAHRQQFVRFVSLVNSSDNIELSRRYPEIPFQKFGYVDSGKDEVLKSYIGFATRSESPIFENRLVKLSIALSYLRRAGCRKAARKAIGKLRKSASHHFKSWASGRYRRIVGGVDRLRGLDFEEIVPLRELGLEGTGNYQYEGSKQFEVARLFAFVGLEPNTVAIDFGSGKGRVVSYLGRHPNVERVYGIEISHVLSQIARKNLAVLRVSKARIITEDARDTPLDILDSANLMYFYNPFSKSIFERVLFQIEASLRRSPRKLMIVCLEPVEVDSLAKSKFFTSRGQYPNYLSNAVFEIYDSVAAAEV